MLKKPATMQVRWMIRRDMPSVLEIEQLAQRYPHTEDEFLKILKNRNSIGMSAEVGDTVLGFVIYELFPNELRLIDLAVDPCCWRRGVGTAMIAKLKAKLGQQKRQVLSIKVPEQQLNAQRFFSRHGFVATGLVETECFTHFNGKRTVDVEQVVYEFRYRAN